MRVYVDGVKVDTKDIIKKHGRDGGLWINSPVYVNMLSLSDSQLEKFYKGEYGVALCTICNQLAVWLGKDRIIQE